MTMMFGRRRPLHEIKGAATLLERNRRRVNISYTSQRLFQVIRFFCRYAWIPI